MLKTLVCVSCIFLRLLYFGEKSIVNCNLKAAGGGFSLGFHGSDLLGSHIAERQERQEDKSLSIVETNRSTRHTSSPRQIRAARAKCLADVGAYWTYRERTTGRKFKRCIYTAPIALVYCSFWLSMIILCFTRCSGSWTNNRDYWLHLRSRLALFDNRSRSLPKSPPSTIERGPKQGETGSREFSLRPSLSFRCCSHRSQDPGSVKVSWHKVAGMHLVKMHRSFAESSSVALVESPS